jgi:hypothetical protein
MKRSSPSLTGPSNPGEQAECNKHHGRNNQQRKHVKLPTETERNRNLARSAMGCSLWNFAEPTEAALPR